MQYDIMVSTKLLKEVVERSCRMMEWSTPTFHDLEPGTWNPPGTQPEHPCCNVP
jgi:hypothetical protein